MKMGTTKQITFKPSEENPEQQTEIINLIITALNKIDKKEDSQVIIENLLYDIERLKK